MATIQERQLAKARHEAGHAACALYFDMLGPEGVTIRETEEEAGSTSIAWNLTNLQSVEKIIQRAIVIMAGIAAEPAGFRSEQGIDESNWMQMYTRYGDLQDDIKKASCLKWIVLDAVVIWRDHIRPYLKREDNVSLDSVVKRLESLPAYSASYESVEGSFQEAKRILAMPQPRCFIDKATDQLLEHGFLTTQKCHEIWDECKTAGGQQGNRMKDEVNSEDIELVIKSLEYYKRSIRDDTFPVRNPQERQQQLQRVEALIAKIRELRNDLRDNPA